MIEGGSSRNFARRMALGALLLCALSGTAQAQTVSYVQLATGFAAITDIANAGDGRLFVAEQNGVIRIVQPNGTVLATPFLDIDNVPPDDPEPDRVIAGGGERGLLGLVFHPNYAQNGFFYVHYSDLNGDTVVARYSVSANPNVANANSELIVFDEEQPFSNHNGGDLAFGPNDGYLYIGLGDGGSGCDPDDRAQDPSDLLGKMLRIDVDGGTPYAIPASNPFVGPDGIPDEIWASGLRNPWRFGFDADPPHDLYIADVGQGQWEEISVQPGSSDGGENYGWDCYEGTHAGTCSTEATCPPPGGHLLPVHEYSHGGGRCSVTGGFVYRGIQSPSLEGRYFFADLCSRTLWSIHRQNGDWITTTYGALVPNGPRTFGEDVNGEVYVGTSGTVYRLDDGTPDPVGECPTTPPQCDDAQKTSFLIKDREPFGPSLKDSMQFRFMRGPAIADGAFGDPTDDTEYRLCVYAGSPQGLISESVVAAGGTCDGKECWKELSSSGYRFRDRAAAQFGAQTILLRAKPGVPVTKILWKGVNGELPIPDLPISEAGAISVRVLNSSNGLCWGADYGEGEIDKNEEGTFLGRAP